MDGACSRYDGEERFIQSLGRVTAGKKPLGRPKRKWEYNIKMDLQEVGFGGMAWIELAHDKDRWQRMRMR
jgi:hypothetical protein